MKKKKKVQSQQIKGNYVRLPPFCMPTLFSEETCKQQTIHKSNSYAEKCQGLQRTHVTEYYSSEKCKVLQYERLQDCLVLFDTFATQDVTEKQLTAQLKSEHELQKQTETISYSPGSICAVAALERYSSTFTTSHKPVELQQVQTD